MQSQAGNGIRSAWAAGGPYKQSLSCLRADWQPQKHRDTAWRPGCFPQPLGLGASSRSLTQSLQQQPRWD